MEPVWLKRGDGEVFKITHEDTLKRCLSEGFVVTEDPTILAKEETPVASEPAPVVEEVPPPTEPENPGAPPKDGEVSDGTTNDDGLDSADSPTGGRPRRGKSAL